MALTGLYTSLGKAYPKGHRASIGRLLSYAGSQFRAELWLGKILLINLLFVALFNPLWIRLSPLWDSSLQSWIILLVINALVTSILQAISYIMPYYAAGRRAKAVESVLPNFYQLMASYLRSGMTPFQALKSASKKEFGTLKTEVDIATSKALGTQSFTDALLGMSSRVKSDGLKRSTELMVRGIESGGSLASLLEESAANLIENRAMRREIIASSRTYTLMIIFAVLIGAPLLLSISTRFNERIIDLTSDIGEGVADIKGLETSLFVGGTPIAPEKLFWISIASIAITAFISSLLVGIINDGNEKYGLKYAVLFVPISLVLFLVFLTILTSIF